MPRSVCFVGHLMLPLLVGSDAPVIGGAEVQMFHLAQELHRRGWRTSFLVCALDDAAVRRYDTPLGPAHVLYRRRVRKTLAQKIAEKRALYAAVLHSDADVIVQRAVWDADVAAYAAARRRIPYVYMVASDRDAVAVPRWTRRRLVLARATSIVVQSRAQQEWVRRYGRESVLLPSGFPLPQAPATPGREILWVATLRALKRPFLFVELAARHPEHAFTLCGGPGEDEHLGRVVAAAAAELPNLNFEGFVPYAAMPERFRRARVLVNTSDYEGFPNTFVQAWLHGVLVLSLGVDPDARLSRDGWGAVAADAEGLDRLVQRAFDDEAWFAKMTARARAQAARDHDIRVVGERFETVLESALGGRA